MTAEVVSLYPIEQPVRLLAPAKVNLFIDVLERRPDGYHDLDAINVSVDLFDEIELTVSQSGEHTIDCDWPDIPTDSRNHLIKAAEELLANSRWSVAIRLKKSIPVGAGLGGGTADAGILLRFLGRALNIDLALLMDVALRVGSDVPYSLIGGNARVRGRGEFVEKIENLPPLRLALVDPRKNHITQSIYGRLAPFQDRRHPPVDLFLQSWAAGDLEMVGSQMFNAFQETVFKLEPSLAEIREVLLSKGCLGACLTGTGSHLVGLVPPSAPPIEDWDWKVGETQIREVVTLPSEFTGWVKHLDQPET
ncbi:MAG: 4-(cytidine 5'-diphospho)-2-C-methyl-D-erythritol kinase [Candidatus Omnitrophica bacterium]|nr:4-(cytidine 5'-diphospho)-2-C-methyl-D-erythritol kinase [Candidatus Omnitrophota bacterium]